MTPKATTSLNVTDEKAQAAFRRLLLAKQLYLHGLDHANKADALNKMIAVHGFHNAIEIVLKAIVSHHDIRIDKSPYRINFEDMLKAIDKYSASKGRETRLPYRKEVTILNQYRNLVQHDAAEPPTTMMEEWRVFTRLFLDEVCETYFGLEFDTLSPLEMIDDEVLRDLLRVSLSGIEENNFKKSLKFAKIAFQLAEEAVWSFLPDEGYLSSFFITSGISDLLRELEEPLNMLVQKARQAEYHAALLWSGVSLVDYKRFESTTPSVEFSVTGEALIYWGQTEPDEETARWVYDFVVTAIVRWQVLGLAPSVSDRVREATQKMIERIGLTPLSKSPSET